MTDFRLPWDDLAPPVHRTPKPAEEKAEARSRSPTAKQARQDRLDAQAATDTGIAWQWWHLVVHGPADEVASFTAAARGPGLIPWRVDDSGFEESVVAFAFGGAERPSLSVADCRILARQFRDAVETRRARNEGDPGRTIRCPLDLQALLPVPVALIHLGPRHPEAAAALGRVELARSHRIDLRALDLLAVVEQLIQATRSETAPSLSQKAAWTVTASWLLLLRSHVMLPAADPRHPAAAGQARQLQAQLLSLQEARALARWLDERPQLGRDVFGRGAPEPGTATQPEPGHLDRIEFLWGCIALFDGNWSTAALDVPAVYGPRPPDLYRVGEARDRVRLLLREAAPTVLVSLADLLPPDERSGRPTAQAQPPARVRHRSAWTSTLMACLEMAKQGELVVEQLDEAVLPAFRSR